MTGRNVATAISGVQSLSTRLPAKVGTAMSPSMDRPLNRFGTYHRTLARGRTVGPCGSMVMSPCAECHLSGLDVRRDASSSEARHRDTAWHEMLWAGGRSLRDTYV